MPTETEASSAVLRLRRAFAGLVALERLSRAFEGLAIGASSAWVLTGLARLESQAAARAALAPAALAGLCAAASWMIERWRDAHEIAARADRVLATPQLIDTALDAPRSAQPGWSELLARRALARFDRTRLWLAAAPAWAATAALVLLAAGAHELLARSSPSEPAAAPLAKAWNTLAEGLEAGTETAADPASAAHAELAAELRRAAELEGRGELGAVEARALLERAAERLAARPDSVGQDGTHSSLAELGKAYGRPPEGSGPGSGAGVTGSPSPGSGSSVPSGAGDGTMGGSTEGGSARLPAPPGMAGGGAEGAVRPTLSARWWPRDQDGLVEAWIARQQRTRSNR
jgi:hypothetical protein